MAYTFFNYKKPSVQTAFDSDYNETELGKACLKDTISKGSWVLAISFIAIVLFVGVNLLWQFLYKNAPVMPDFSGSWWNEAAQTIGSALLTALIAVVTFALTSVPNFIEYVAFSLPNHPLRFTDGDGAIIDTFVAAFIIGWGLICLWSLVVIGVVMYHTTFLLRTSARTLLKARESMGVIFNPLPFILCVMLFCVGAGMLYVPTLVILQGLPDYTNFSFINFILSVIVFIAIPAIVFLNANTQEEGLKHHVTRTITGPFTSFLTDVCSVTVQDPKYDLVQGQKNALQNERDGLIRQVNALQENKTLLVIKSVIGVTLGVLTMYVLMWLMLMNISIMLAVPLTIAGIVALWALAAQHLQCYTSIVCDAQALKPAVDDFTTRVEAAQEELKG